MLRANQSTCLLIDLDSEKVVLRSSEMGCIKAANEHGKPCEVVSLISGLVKEVKAAAPPAKKAAKKKAAHGNKT